MAKLPTPEDVARRILHVAVYDLGKRPNELLGTEELISSFVKIPYREIDLPDGLEYAVSQSWINYDPQFPFLKLNQSGFDAA